MIRKSVKTNPSQKKRLLKHARIFFIPFIKASSLLVFLICLYVLFQHVGVDAASFMALTEQYIEQLGNAGIFCFLILSAFGTFFFVPRQLLSLVAGYFYGVTVAVCIVSCGAGLGCLFSMGYGNFLAKRFFQRRMHKRIACLENIFTKSTFGIALGIRIMPIGCNTLLNMLVGATKIPFWKFWAGSAFGYIPQNFIFALLGSAGKTESGTTVLMSVLLYGSLLVAGFLIVKKNLPRHITLKYLYNGIVKGEV